MEPRQSGFRPEAMVSFLLIGTASILVLLSPLAGGMFSLSMLSRCRSRGPRTEADEEVDEGRFPHLGSCATFSFSGFCLAWALPWMKMSTKAQVRRHPAICPSLQVFSMM